MSNVSKGNYYKRKTRQYFERMGYHVVLTEYTTVIPIKGRNIYVKRDLMGSDGIAMSKEKNEFILWNSKATTEERKDGVAKHKHKGKKDFSQFPFPDCVKRQVIIWKPREKEPTIINC